MFTTTDGVLMDRFDIDEAEREAKANRERLVIEMLDRIATALERIADALANGRQ